MATKTTETKKQFVYGTGCEPSKMDGTEHILNVDDKIELPEEYTWQDSMPPVRNQGMTSTCVCQSLTSVLDFLHNSEVGVSGVCNNYSIDELYSIRSNKPGDGMTFKEALHYLRHHGLNGQKINEYSKINSGMIAKYAIVMFGPVVCGLPVYSGNVRKFWNKRGSFQGGHAVTLVGYNKEGFIIRNSWGTEWGDRGHVTIPYDEFENFCFEAWTIIL